MRSLLWAGAALPSAETVPELVTKNANLLPSATTLHAAACPDILQLTILSVTMVAQVAETLIAIQTKNAMVEKVVFLIAAAITPMVGS